MIDFILILKLIAGFGLLVVGGDFLVRGALAFGVKRDISPLIVGVTVVAMGTSAPEMVVSVLSAMTGHAQIAVGNVIGSNIANVLLVLGVPVLIHPITTQQEGLRDQVYWMLMVTLGFTLVCLITDLNFWVGIAMLASLAIFLQQSVKGSIPLPALNEVTEELDDLPKENHSYLRIAGLIGFGVLALPFGADLVVDAGSTLAVSLGVSESVIGLSVFALGTSLPELASTTVAAVYRNSDVALGNVLGSNLFNILAVLGVTLMLTDIQVDEAFLRMDIWVMMGCATLLWFYCIVGVSIGRVSGIFFLVGYVAYISSLFTG